jgi:hypothetical protein
MNKNINEMEQPHIPEILLSPYNPETTEVAVINIHEKSNLANPDECIKLGVTSESAPSFSIILPPPNVTGTLHLGHGLMATLQDVSIRFTRMNGMRALWIPGTDHAAIATQSKVEKEISKKEGKSRYDLGREEMLRRIEEFAQSSRNTIVSQIKRMGASLDWSREAYTLDEKRNHAVRTMFKNMYDDGLITKGFRIVNWDPKGQTTIADDEIVYKEETVKFYYFKYGPLPYNQALRYLEELLKKAKIKDIDVETRQKIVQVADGAPGFILAHLQTYLTSGEIPNEKELDAHKAGDLYKAFRKCTTDTIKGDDMSHSMNHLLTVLTNFKQNQGEWESVRIAFLIYIHFTMKSSIENGKFTQKNREIFTAYYDLLTPFLMENKLGEYDMVSRIMKMIEARKNIEIKYKGEINGSKED